MSTQHKIIKNKVGLLRLAKEPGNVSRACKVMGYSRDTFYRYKQAVDEGGVEARGLGGDKDELRRESGHLYFGEDRTSVLWADSRQNAPILPMPFTSRAGTSCGARSRSAWRPTSRTGSTV